MWRSALKRSSPPSGGTEYSFVGSSLSSLAVRIGCVESSHGRRHVKSVRRGKSGGWEAPAMPRGRHRGDTSTLTRRNLSYSIDITTRPAERAKFASVRPHGTAESRRKLVAIPCSWHQRRRRARGSQPNLQMDVETWAERPASDADHQNGWPDASGEAVPCPQAELPSHHLMISVRTPHLVSTSLMRWRPQGASF